MSPKEQLKPFETTEHQRFSQMAHVFGLNYDLNAKIEVLFTGTEGALKSDCVISCLLKFRAVSESCFMSGKTLKLHRVQNSQVSAITYFKKVVKLLCRS